MSQNSIASEGNNHLDFQLAHVPDTESTALLREKRRTAPPPPPPINGKKMNTGILIITQECNKKPAHCHLLAWLKFATVQIGTY